MVFIPNTEAERKEMLEVIGVESFEELIADIPKSVRLKGDLNIPKALSEYEVTKLMKKLAAQNADTDNYINFLGAGVYDHYIPAAINHILLRSEFYTAYTPYQPEVSQGTLQTIYEYQSMICELTDMDVSNASVYDGGSAVAEAALMAKRLQRKSEEIIILDSVNPIYRKVVETYISGIDVPIVDIPITEKGTVDLEILKEKVSKKTACVIVQYPNFFGCLEDLASIEKIVHEAGSLLVVSVDPISLGILKAPGKYGADIVVGEGQGLGNFMSYGGPFFGFFACKQKYIRQMPGRIVGITTDHNGQRGFVLTLQTREQHIRREKATSNICTNQALNALAATIYMALMGKNGISEVAEACLQKSHYACEQICKLDGYAKSFDSPFFKEFVVDTPIPAAELVNKLADNKIFAGVPLSRFFPEMTHKLMIAVTEKRTKEEIDALVERLNNL